MKEKMEIKTLVGGLKTKSDQIRALANVGYTRAEISKILNIRYQHVRNVLVGSNITGGLRRPVEVVREPLPVEVKPGIREKTRGDFLLRSGFRLLGEWTLDVQKKIRLNVTVPADTGVYCFLADDYVMYIGLTANGLKTRMDQYRRGHKGQKTSYRVNGLIAKALADGQCVKVLVAFPKPLKWKRLPVNTAAGLEAGLIQMIKPPWNILGAI